MKYDILQLNAEIREMSRGEARILPYVWRGLSPGHGERGSASLEVEPPAGVQGQSSGRGQRAYPSPNPLVLAPGDEHPTNTPDGVWYSVYPAQLMSGFRPSIYLILCTPNVNAGVCCCRVVAVLRGVAPAPIFKLTQHGSTGNASGQVSGRGMKAVTDLST